ncbi:MAG: MBL fold metallo-hydrolase [Bifidobacteriaceae bacterium]|jgi:glyoxylase-like metal-dependent hydrolase (beta-lactamase superfamily II)|nr:MBL fold metallo-hydrolase [Bifidobacteriaceae bacterium]
MFLAGLTTSVFQANCYLVGPDQTDRCVIIDPGLEAAGPVRTVLDQAGRTPAAVLATHGHLDHIADAATLADGFGIPLWIHAADRPFLTDPAAAVNAELEAMFRHLGLGPFNEPLDVREYSFDGPTGSGRLEVAGLAFTLRQAPGHTPGCTMLVLDDAATDGETGTLVFTGDVVFAGAIGRTDFRVGDPTAMRASLRHQVLTLPAGARLLPGHGPDTTLGYERATNPYLQADFLADC